jgi:MFS family permease
MLKQSSFPLIYVMMTLVAFGGLVVTSQLKEIAGFYRVDKVIVAWGQSASILAIQLNRFVNGITRPLWGWISDPIGRENAMFTAFLIEGLAVWAWLQTIHRPVLGNRDTYGLSGAMLVSCCCPAPFTLPGARSSRFSHPLPPICTGGNGRPRITGWSTRPRARPPQAVE